MTAIPHPLVVLLVDDDDNDVLLIRRAFSRLDNGARLIRVADGEQAIACLQGDGEYADRARWPIPHVLLLDHWMPRLGGLDVLCWIRTYPPLATIPVIIISGGLSPEQSELMQRLDATCCHKQSGLAATADAIARALASAWTARDRSLPAAVMASLRPPAKLLP